ncbi:hypothetical protein IWQ56_004313 [Coemansia nantahalensis]|nr:hypothetical protein IWQ56_004313 [Coemansia nantahalensis]
MTDTLEALYTAHSAQLANGKPAAAVLATFRNIPPHVGASLDTLQPIGGGPGALPLAPGPVVGDSSDGKPAPYYLAFDDGTAGKMLWFRIDASAEGHETIGASGWHTTARQ